jgi:hypothetical protein
MVTEISTTIPEELRRRSNSREDDLRDMMTINYYG